MFRVIVGAWAPPRPSAATGNLENARRSQNYNFLLAKWSVLTQANGLDPTPPYQHVRIPHGQAVALWLWLCGCESVAVALCLRGCVAVAPWLRGCGSVGSKSNIFRIGFSRRFNICKARNHRSYKQHDFEIHHFSYKVPLAFRKLQS